MDTTYENISVDPFSVIRINEYLWIYFLFLDPLAEAHYYTHSAADIVG
jgi:hypothetical protein